MVDEFSLYPDSTINISIYPNPANIELNITLNIKDNDEWQFYIVDMNGLVIMKDWNLKIDIANLIPGTYILYGVLNGSYTLGEKFIKK